MQPQPSPPAKPSDLRELFKQLSLALSGAESSSTFAFVRAGKRFVATWVPPAKNTPAGLKLGIQADGSAALFSGAVRGPFRESNRPVLVNPAPVTLRREGPLDRWGKRMHINREIQTGDRAFDAEVYIESNAPDDALQMLFADSRVRQGSVACLQWWKTLTLDRAGYLTMFKLGLALEDLSVERVVSMADGLHELAGGLPLLMPGPKRPRGWWKQVLVIVAVLGSSVSLFGAAIAGATWDVIDDGLAPAAILAAFGAWLIVVPLLFLMLRGRSTSLRDIALANGFLTIGLPSMFFGALYVGNCGLDFSTPSAHEATVLSRHVSRGSKSTSYYVTVESWRGARPVTINVSYNSHLLLPEGSTAIVRTRPGLLGWEWLESVERKWH